MTMFLIHHNPRLALLLKRNNAKLADMFFDWKFASMHRHRDNVQSLGQLGLA
jgi:hypothetical protein